MTGKEFTRLLTKAATTDDPELLAQVTLAIEEGEVDFREHITDTLRLADELNMTIVGIDSEIKRLEVLKLEREARVKRLRGYVQWTLEQVGESQWHDELHTVLIKRNPPKVVIESEALVPSEYRKVTIKEVESIDKKAIAEAIKNGVPVDGCKLIQEFRMEIK